MGTRIYWHIRDEEHSSAIHLVFAKCNRKTHSLSPLLACMLSTNSSISVHSTRNSYIIYLANPIVRTTKYIKYPFVFAMNAQFRILYSVMHFRVWISNSKYLPSLKPDFANSCVCVCVQCACIQQSFKMLCFIHNTKFRRKNIQRILIVNLIFHDYAFLFIFFISY